MSPSAKSGRNESTRSRPSRATPASLAEGVFTAPVAQKLARQYDIDAPLIDAVNLLLSGSVTIDKILAGLMSRPLKRED